MALLCSKINTMLSFISSVGLSWPWTHYVYIYLYNHITTNVVSSNPAHGEVYNIMW